MLDKAEDQKERDQKESQEQHSSLADSKMMTISKFAWDEKVEQVRQLREELKETKRHLGEEIAGLEFENSKLVKALEWYGERENYSWHSERGERPAAWDSGQIARDVLSEIKGQGENGHD